MDAARLIRLARKLALLAAGLAAFLHVQAAVVIAGTRVIYNANEREVTVKLSNAGQTPALTQVWLDDGDASASPATVAVPFTVTPPVARLDPGKGQTLRIFHTGEAMPKDRESVYWLNVLEVPPTAKGQADANMLQMAFRTRIKLFYRPSGLPGSADEAATKIEWRLLRNGTAASLQAHNPTAFFVSLATAQLVGADKSAKFDLGGMVGPGETKEFPLKGELPPTSLTLHYEAINDFGGAVAGDSPLH